METNIYEKLVLIFSFIGMIFLALAILAFFIGWLHESLTSQL